MGGGGSSLQSSLGFLCFLASSARCSLAPSWPLHTLPRGPAPCWLKTVRGKAEPRGPWRTGPEEAPASPSPSANRGGASSPPGWVVEVGCAGAQLAGPAASPGPCSAICDWPGSCHLPSAPSRSCLFPVLVLSCHLLGGPSPLNPTMWQGWGPAFSKPTSLREKPRWGCWPLLIHLLCQPGPVPPSDPGYTSGIPCGRHTLFCLLFQNSLALAWKFQGPL